MNKESKNIWLHEWAALLIIIFRHGKCAINTLLYLLHKMVSWNHFDMIDGKAGVWKMIKEPLICSSWVPHYFPLIFQWIAIISFSTIYSAVKHTKISKFYIIMNEWGTRNVEG